MTLNSQIKVIMNISRSELNAVLTQFNPWWDGSTQAKTPPSWHRTAFNELLEWIKNPPTNRAVLLTGARQVGKTTLLLQAIQNLIESGVSPSNIVYITFDHPLIKLAGIDEVLSAWQEKEIIADNTQYLFVDEAQFVPNWGTWIKHQIDFCNHRRIIFTGSALPLIDHEIESNVGRTHTIKLATLSFYEFLQLKKVETLKQHHQLWDSFKHVTNYKDLENISSEELAKATSSHSLPKLPQISSLEDLFNWSPNQFQNVSSKLHPINAHFQDYLARGGFPQLAKTQNVEQAQTLLREDIVDKALKRDMTALFGVRRIQELEHTFLYLCMHDGGQLDMQMLSSNLGIKTPTAKKYINLLESTHLIHCLNRYGYGKEVLRGKKKAYLSDAAIAPAVFLKGKSFLDNPDSYGKAIETVAFNHLYSYFRNSSRFTYWLGKNKDEVDIIVEKGSEHIPFEIKQRSNTSSRKLKGLQEFCQKKKPKFAYIITKSTSEFGLVEATDHSDTQYLKIPAPLFCYWLGEMEAL